MPPQRQYYKYDPALAPSVIFSIVFGLSTIYHVYQLSRWRTWYFVPFLLGCLFQSFGYVIRCVSIGQAPGYEKGPYIIQFILILLAPALFAASIYMVLGRLILLLRAESLALIRRRWLTKIFVSGDVASIIIQGIGASFVSSADTTSKQDLGSNIVVVGLFVQVVIFSFFIVVTALFHRRIQHFPTPESALTALPWGRYIMTLYGASGLIMIRSVVRVIEFIQGKDGELMTHEVYFYIFDTLLMFSVSVLFNIFHPKAVIIEKDGGQTPLRDI